MHVDHWHRKFADIAHEWLDTVKGYITISQRLLEDRILANDWQTFHQTQADFRLLCVDCHMYPNQVKRYWKPVPSLKQWMVPKKKLEE
jgi:hypothetical protein